MERNESTPKPGASVVLLTKPFVNSEELRITEGEVLRVTALHIEISKNGRGRFCVPRETVAAWEVAQ